MKRALAFALLVASAGCSSLPPLDDAHGRDGAGAPHVSVVAASQELDVQEAWLARKTLGDGAILYTNVQIEPYYANVAATGETTVPSKLYRVRNWMRWYVGHLNVKDRWGLRGTIYDYRYDPRTGRETATGRADSIDSYAATFFTLARALYDTGDGTSRRFVGLLRAPLGVMGAMLVKIQQPDGMTVALPDYPVAFLMDNAEAYRGLRDLAYVERNAFGDAHAAAAYDRAAARVAGGIASLWSEQRRTYDEAKQEPSGPSTPSRWRVWYPDATAQLFPALQGVIPPTSPRARGLWTAFNAAYPQWDRLDFPDSFPWALVGAAALAQGDTGRAVTYVSSVQKRFGPSFPWPWYDLEAGWYMRTLASLPSPQR